MGPLHLPTKNLLFLRLVSSFTLRTLVGTSCISPVIRTSRVRDWWVKVNFSSNWLMLLLLFRLQILSSKALVDAEILTVIS